MNLISYNYEILYYSPFILAPILESFYETADDQPRNVLLSYLVLPLTLSPSSQNFLKNSNITSSLRTFTKNRENLFGLPERVQEYRDITNICIQLAINAGGIRIKEADLSIEFINKNLDASSSPKNAIKAAQKFGKILKPLDIPSIYRFLGVKLL